MKAEDWGCSSVGRMLAWGTENPGFRPQHCRNQWWYTPLIPAPGGAEVHGHPCLHIEHEASLSYMVLVSCFKKIYISEKQLDKRSKHQCSVALGKWRQPQLMTFDVLKEPVREFWTFSTRTHIK